MNPNNKTHPYYITERPFPTRATCRDTGHNCSSPPSTTNNTPILTTQHPSTHLILHHLPPLPSPTLFRVVMKKRERTLEEHRNVGKKVLEGLTTLREPPRRSSRKERSGSRDRSLLNKKLYNRYEQLANSWEHIFGLNGSASTANSRSRGYAAADEIGRAHV